MSRFLRCLVPVLAPLLAPLLALLGFTACGPSQCGQEAQEEASGGADRRAEAREQRPPQDVGTAVRRIEEARTPSERSDAIYDLDELSADENEDAITALRKALEDEDRRVAESAIDQLELMDSDASAEALGAVLERSRDPELKIRSLDALSSREGAAAARAAARGLSDESREVREAAVDAVELIGDPASVEALWQAHRGEQDESLREMILFALESFGEDVDRYLDDY